MAVETVKDAASVRAAVVAVAAVVKTGVMPQQQMRLPMVRSPLKTPLKPAWKRAGNPVRAVVAVVVVVVAVAVAKEWPNP